MKKFYSFLFAAVALVGFAACNSDNTEEPAPAGVEKVSFTANIENTKTELDGLQTIWCEGDVVKIEGFEFVCGDDLATFTCTQDNCTSLLNKEVTAVYSNKGDNKIDSEAGVHGALLTATGKLTTEGGSFNFAVQNAFLKLTTTGAVTLKADQEIFSTGTELTIEGENTDAVYVAINPLGDVKLSCESFGKEVKPETDVNLAVKKIYNLGNLEAATVFYVEGNADFNLYAWSGSTKIMGEWPGTAMTRIGSTNKYYAVIPDEYVGETFNYIVNWNGGQTKDLTVEEFASGYTYSISDPDPNNITIYLNNNWSVQDLKIHSWEPTLWAGQNWDNRKAPNGTVPTDWGTFSYWNIEKAQIANDKVGSLLVTGTGKQTADLHNVNYENDVYLQFAWNETDGDHLEILTTPY